MTTLIRPDAPPEWIPDEPAPPRPPKSPGHESRRPRWLVPVGILLIWIALAVVLAGQAGKLGTVVESGATGYLPAGSASRQVAELTQAYGDEVSLPGVVIWTRDGGDLTSADTREIDAQIAALAKDFDGDLTSAGVIGPLPSDDGRAVQVVLPFAGDDTDVAGAHVQDARALLDSPQLPDGLQVAVTGPAGVQADMKEALGAIDFLLIGVTSALILVILFAVYRSLLLPFLVIMVGGVALGSAMGMLYLLAKADVIQIGAEVQGIISVLVLGCATDYAILLTSRYSTQLRTGADPAAAMKVAWRKTVEPVVASAATVILGLLCLLFSDLGLNKQLGPAAAIGVFFAMVAMLTLMPAVLVLLGRSAFWPRKLTPVTEGSGTITTKLAHVVGRHPRVVWTVTAVLLLACATGVLGLNAGGLSDSDMVIGDDVESRTGQQRVDTHFPGGVGSPVIILVDADEQTRARRIVERLPAVDSVQVWTGPDQGPGAADAPARVVDGRVRLDATLAPAPDSGAAIDAVTQLRVDLADVGTAAEPTLVGGQTAVKIDFNDAAISDRWVLLLLLAVVLIVIGLLLRSIVAALVVVASVVLSFLAAMGVSTLVFQHLLGFPGVDATFPIHAFVFLVALGVDYSIFLMSRVREEVLEHGPHEGVLRGLRQTSGVITSAGLVLAATFASLALVPLVLMVQLAFIVAFGVIVDTLIVRSMLVPALALDLGRHMWWPHPRLSQPPAPTPRHALL